jgi:hypothetical protein
MQRKRKSKCGYLANNFVYHLLIFLPENIFRLSLSDCVSLARPFGGAVKRMRDGEGEKGNSPLRHFASLRATSPKGRGKVTMQRKRKAKCGYLARKFVYYFLTLSPENIFRLSLSDCVSLARPFGGTVERMRD